MPAPRTRQPKPPPSLSVMVMHPELGSVFGWLGTVFTLVYFLSPVPTCMNVVKSKSVQEFSAFPYAMGVFNCSCWVYYCVVTMEASSKDLTPNMVVNGVGALMFLCYVSIFLVYAGSRLTSILRLVLTAILVEALLIGFCEGVVPSLHKGFHWGTSPSMKSSVSGLTCVVINVLLYGSPLVMMKTVIQTRSVKYMPLPMSLLGFVICILWSAQAVFIQDVTVGVPNVLGIILGAAQLVLYAFYCRESGDASRDLMLSHVSVSAA